MASSVLLAAGGCTGKVRTQARALPESWRIDYATDSSDATFDDVAPVSKDEGWAIGGVATEHVLLRRQGGTWQQTTLPIPQTRAWFNTHLAASAADNVWLFTGMFGPHDANDEPTDMNEARRWDGHQWLTIPIDFSPLDVAVLAPDDVWALDSSLAVGGRPRTRHWDGQRWTEQVLPHPTTSLSASGPRDLWAVGQQDDPNGGTQAQPAAMHFDGTAWQSMPMPDYRFAPSKPNEAATLSEVVAVSPNNVWAFGDHSDNPGTTVSTGHHAVIVLHWDGSQWRKVPKTPDSTPDIHPFPDLAASGDGAGGYVLAGYQHGAANGTRRVIGRPAPPPTTAEDLVPTGQFSVNDLHLIPGTREVWAAGFISVGTSSGKLRGIIAFCTLNG